MVDTQSIEERKGRTVKETPGTRWRGPERRGEGWCRPRLP